MLTTAFTQQVKRFIQIRNNSPKPIQIGLCLVMQCSSKSKSTSPHLYTNIYEVYLLLNVSCLSHPINDAIF